MTDTTLVRCEQDVPAADRLSELTAALAQDLAAGSWCPGPLERSLARRLLLASAGDGELTADRVRTVLWEGAVAVHHVGEGRLASLLGQLVAVAVARTPDAGAGSGARLLLERIAHEEGEHGDLR